MSDELNNRGDSVVADVILFLRRHWILITLVSLSGMVGGLGTTFLIKPVYRATTQVMAATAESSAGGLATLSRQFGGLASLAGLDVSLPTGNAKENVAILKSKGFSKEFIEQNELRKILFDDMWDPEADRWDVESEKDIPTLEDAFRYFDKEVRSIFEDTRSGVISLSIEWTDPRLAALWANALVDHANGTIRQRAIEEARKTLKYLSEELERTSVVEVRQGIYSLLERQIRDAALANVREEFAFRVIDRAAPPDLDDPIWPSKPLFGLVGLLFGFAGTVLCLLIAKIVREMSATSGRV